MKIPGAVLDVFLLAVIGASLLGVLALLVPDAQFDVLLPIAGAFVGGLVGLMFARIAPRPDPSVPEGIAALILAHAFGSTVPQLDAPKSGPVPWRRNVLMIIVIAAAVVILLAAVFAQNHPVAVLTVAGGFVGLCGTISGDLAKPEPEPCAPASLIRDALSVVATRQAQASQ